MKVNPALVAVFLMSLPFGVTACSAQAAVEQAYLGSMGSAGGVGEPSTASDPESAFYARGTRAINDGRWSDAVSIFKKIAEDHGQHADGALYWIAYAENKQGQTSQALDTCAGLRRVYPRSRWIDECGALEIEIRSRNGQPVQTNISQDEDLKLLALNSLMRQDETRSLAQIEKIPAGAHNDPVSLKRMMRLLRQKGLPEARLNPLKAELKRLNREQSWDSFLSSLKRKPSKPWGHEEK